MSKKGMKRPERTHSKERNKDAAVPELDGKAKNSKKKANPVIEDSSGEYKVWHEEKPIPSVYKDIDNDLAVENLENHIPESDRRGV